MTLEQFLITAGIALAPTIPSVLFIPRARQSPIFGRLLWLATWFFAFLCSWVVIGNVRDDPSFSSLNSSVWNQIPLIPTVVGASLGALALNLLLCAMDRFAAPSSEEDALTEAAPVIEEENVEASRYPSSRSSWSAIGCTCSSPRSCL